MQIVIDIDDRKYTEIKEDAEKFRHKDMVVPYLYKVIESGISLPKGHGDLIDINEITAFRELECNGRNVESLDEFTVIIKADKAESENEE